MRERESGKEQWSVRHIEWEIPNEEIFEMEDKYLGGIDEAMRAQGWSQDEIENVHYGINELLQSAILHGNLDWESPKEDAGWSDDGPSREDQIMAKLDEVKKQEGSNTGIKFWGDVSREQVVFFIQDHGKNFHKTETRKITKPIRNERGELQPSGYGKILIDSLGNEVGYEINEIGTLTTLRRDKSK